MSIYIHSRRYIAEEDIHERQAQLLLTAEHAGGADELERRHQQHDRYLFKMRLLCGHRTPPFDLSTPKLYHTAAQNSTIEVYSANFLNLLTVHLMFINCEKL